MDSSTFHRGGLTRLSSPRIWDQGPLCVHFAYHMFGLSWGSQLKLLLFRGTKNKHPHLLWKHLNTQSLSWMPTAVTVPIGHTLPSWVRLRMDPGAPVGIWVSGDLGGAGTMRGEGTLDHLNSGKKLGA